MNDSLHESRHAARTFAMPVAADEWWWHVGRAMLFATLVLAGLIRVLYPV